MHTFSQSIICCLYLFQPLYLLCSISILFFRTGEAMFPLFGTELVLHFIRFQVSSPPVSQSIVMNRFITIRTRANFCFIPELSRSSRNCIRCHYCRWDKFSASVSHWLFHFYQLETSSTSSSLSFYIFIRGPLSFTSACKRRTTFPPSLTDTSTMLNSRCLSLAIAFLSISLSIAHTPGTVTVDAITFDKVIRNFDVVLAKFDDKYRTYSTPRSVWRMHRRSLYSFSAHGDKHDQFKSFADHVASTKNLLLAEIPIMDYGDKENEQLGKDYGVSKSDFPAYKLFLKGNSKPIDYTGDKTEDDLKRFLSQNTSKALITEAAGWCRCRLQFV